MLPDFSPQETTLDAMRGFARRDGGQVLGISALLLIPCFWHRHIVASDLGSHLYNVWLAQLIHHGEVPGLWLSSQRTNVMFDLLLGAFGSVFGLHAAERIVVSFSILLFFWGSFALVAAAARRAPWFLAPLLAMVAFGYTFQMGFFNYYLSLGFSFFGLAILWRGRGRERWAALILVPLILVAHPIGFVWFAAAGCYIIVAEKIPVRLHALLVALSLAALYAAHRYLLSHYITEPAPRPLYVFNGADQLWLFGDRYRILMVAAVAFALIACGWALLSRSRERFALLAAIPFELYLITLAAVPLLPRGITFGSKRRADRAVDRTAHIRYRCRGYLHSGDAARPKMAPGGDCGPRRRFLFLRISGHR